jgi:hypothetical protein
MDPLSVVKHLNPLRNDSSGERFGREDSRVSQLGFERTEKAFSYCIIPAICPTAHTTSDIRFEQSRSVVATGILAPSVGMKNQSDL